MRPSTCLLFLTGLLFFTFCFLMWGHPALTEAKWTARRETNCQIVRRLGITDLCLFTDARYTRHPSQADFFSAFQDHPGALEHFPSGSFMPPPAHLQTFFADDVD